MFRIGIKFPSKPHDRIYKIKKYEYSRLYSATRYRGSQSCLVHKNDNCKKVGIPFGQGQSGARFSSESPKSEPRRGRGLIFLGAITLSTVAVLTAAKNNSDIRNTLESWIPGTDRTIRVIFQEDGSYFEHVLEYFENMKQSIVGGIFGEEEKKPSEKEEKKGQIRNKVNDTIFEKYTPPKPTFEPLVSKKAPPINDSYAEIRRSKDKGEDIQVVVEKPLPPKKEISEELKPANLVELETFCGQAAGKAISAYQDAIKAISDFNQDVVKVIESDGNTPSNISSPLWQRLKETTERRKRALHQAEENAAEALQALKRLSNLVDDPKFDAPPVMKSVSRRNVKKIIDDVDDAKKKYEAEERSVNITDRYWNKVKAARESFNEELQILFPNINIHEKNFSVNEEAFDLFVLHMYNRVNYLQKELEKLETVDSAKLKSALKGTGDHATEEKINELVCRELNKEKRLINEESAKKLLAEKKTFEEEIRRQLKLQAQVNADHLKEILEAKEKENQRIVSRVLSEQAEAESNKYKTQLAVIVGRLRGLDEALKLRLSEEKGACDAQMLWAACQALARAIKVSPSGAPTDQPVRPLEAEIKAVTKVAPKDDALVQATLAGIPEEAVKRGIFPEDALRERFLKVEHVARRLALVPDGGASLPIYLFSYLQNFLLLKAISPIPKSELSDEPIDVTSLDTYDILNRARYWLDRGDFKMTLRYMNLLKGASRSVARDWMNETRILLETQQAVDTLIAYAGAIGLVFLGSGDNKKQN